MIKRAFLIAGGVLLLAASAHAQTDAALADRAKAIHDKAIAIDTHVDIPPDFATAAYDFNLPGKRGQQVHIPTMIEGGLDAPFLIVYVGQGERNTQGYAKALSDAFLKFSAIHRAAEQQYPDRIELATTAADVRRIIASGKKPVLIGMENGYPMGKDLRLLDLFQEYGARYFGLVHSGHNDLADSSLPQARLKDVPEEHNGLTDLGKQVVARLNELGIMVDVSHSSNKSTLDMIATSKAPVIASHSSVKGVYDHARNMSDEALDALKKNGGVIQIVAFDAYLRPVAKEKTEAVQALLKELDMANRDDFAKLTPQQLAAYDARMLELDTRWPKAGVRDLVDHIDYAVQRIGIDHVGISSDFNGGGGIAGWMGAADTPNVTLELVKRGYTEEQIVKLWGGNLLRVMEDVEKHAARTGKKSR